MKPYSKQQPCGCIRFIPMVALALMLIMAAIPSCATPPQETCVTAHAAAVASPQGIQEAATARTAFWGKAQ